MKKTLKKYEKNIKNMIQTVGGWGGRSFGSSSPGGRGDARGRVKCSRAMRGRAKFSRATRGRVNFSRARFGGTTDGSLLCNRWHADIHNNESPAVPPNPHFD